MGSQRGRLVGGCVLLACAAAAACCYVHLRDEIRIRLAKLINHALEIELMEPGRDRTPPLRPRLRIRRYEALTHDILQH